MRIFYVPQRRDVGIDYSFNGEVIVASVDGVSDVFDFTQVPDGVATKIHSALDPCPVLAAQRVAGELRVTLLRSIPARPSDPEELEAWKRLWTDIEKVVANG